MSPSEIVNLILLVLNLITSVLFVLCYTYQYIYALIILIKKPPVHKNEPKRTRIAVLVSARNEERVIGNLIDCLTAQDYPKELTSIFVLADNCTDNTAAIAAQHGATVYERENKTEIGKGYALEYLLARLDEDYGKGAFDAFVVFDADNLVEPNFLTEINKTHSDGYEVVVGYRNTKNYGDSWVSAGYGLWYLRDSVILNGARLRIGACAMICGTGYLFSNKVKEQNGGWPFHLLTEDAEFTAKHASEGDVFGYCPEAQLYDEQPARFSVSWRQRLRWAKGGIQVFVKYARGLIGGIFKKKTFLSCYDLSMSIAPAYLLTVFATFINALGILAALIAGDPIPALIQTASIFVGGYIMLFIFGILTTALEWKRIRASAFKKILYLFTFPLFMYSYIPIAIVALFKKVEWKPIEHTAAVSIDELHKASPAEGDEERDNSDGI